MTYTLIEERTGEFRSAKAHPLPLAALKALGSPLAARIVRTISKDASYPAALAKQLDVHEQKIYYHIRKLEQAGILVVAKEEKINGSLAKHYALAAPVICSIIGQLQASANVKTTNKEEEEYLSPFIKDGCLNAIIVTGSPDPHGPEKARSRDGYYGIDLGLFLGKYLHYTGEPVAKLDTEFRQEDWQQNIIMIGGPVTNRVVAAVNEHLPIQFDATEHNNVRSTITGQLYTADEVGVVQKVPNPYAEGKWILVIAGKRYTGTRAGIIAFLKSFKQLIKGNHKRPKIHAKVVEGVDLDSDGLVDAVEVRE